MGHWLTDASALRPLLLPAPHLLRQTCTFTLQAPAWAGPWKPRLALRFSSSPSGSPSNGSSDGDGASSDGASSSGASGSGSSGGSGGSVQRPASSPPPPLAKVLALPFSGGAWDAAYNRRHGSGFNFSTPTGGVRRALLVSFVTGHGEDDGGCAEFCGSQHTWAVNGERLRVSRQFGEAGNLWGCSEKVGVGGWLGCHVWWAGGGSGSRRPPAARPNVAG